MSVVNLNLTGIDLSDVKPAKLVTGYLGPLDKDNILTYMIHSARDGKAGGICRTSFQMLVDEKEGVTCVGTVIASTNDKEQRRHCGGCAFLRELTETCDRKGNRYIIGLMTLCCYRDESSDKKDTEESAHANALIIDTHSKTIERFDPSGAYREWEDKHLQQYFATCLPAYKYRSPTVDCPIWSSPQLQQAQLESGGYCQPWTLLLTHLKILNPSWGFRDLGKLLTYRFSPEELLLIVQKYLTLLYQMAQWGHALKKSEWERIMKPGSYATFLENWIKDVSVPAEHGKHSVFPGRRAKWHWREEYRKKRLHELSADKSKLLQRALEDLQDVVVPSLKLSKGGPLIVIGETKGNNSRLARAEWFSDDPEHDIPEGAAFENDIIDAFKACVRTWDMLKDAYLKLISFGTPVVFNEEDLKSFQSSWVVDGKKSVPDLSDGVKKFLTPGLQFWTLPTSISPSKFTNDLTNKWSPLPVPHKQNIAAHAVAEVLKTWKCDQPQWGRWALDAATNR